MRRVCFPLRSPLRAAFCRFTSSFSDRRQVVTRSILLGKIAEGIHDVEIVKWHVELDKSIKAFEPLCDVRSAKATLEITSRYTGKIQKIYTPEGERHPVGKPLVDIQTPPDLSPRGSCGNTLHPACPRAETPQDKKVGRALQRNQRKLASPLARQLAKDFHVNLETLRPQTPELPITAQDVRHHFLALHREKKGRGPVFSTSGPSSLSSPHSKTLSVLPMKEIQRAMKRSVKSTLTIPSFGVTEEVDMGKILQLRVRIDRALRRLYTLKALTLHRVHPSLAQKKPGLPLLCFLMKALSLALTAHPRVNSQLLPEDQIKICSDHHIGFAVDTKQGLLVPNLKNVEQRDLLSLVVHTTRIIQDAREGKLSADDLSGGTVTLSNIGSIGTIQAYPLLRAPEVCVGAVSRIRTLPRYNRKGRLFPRPIAQVTFVADHRVLDGAELTRFSNAFKFYLENPLLLFLNTLPCEEKRTL